MSVKVVNNLFHSRKEPCRVATTANITLSGEQTIDTVAVKEYDRVLVKDQSTASENGIYEARASAWVRDVDADSFEKRPLGCQVFVQLGGVGAQQFFTQTATNVWEGSGAAGDVVEGPASATNNAAVRFDTTTGKLVQDSDVLIADGDDTGTLTLTPATTGASAAITLPEDVTNGSHSLTIRPAASMAASQTATFDFDGDVTISGGDGNIDLDTLVVGPGTAVDNAVARFDLTTGKLVQSSDVAIADGDGSGPNSVVLGPAISGAQAYIQLAEDTANGTASLAIQGAADQGTGAVLTIDLDGNVTLSGGDGNVDIDNLTGAQVADVAADATVGGIPTVYSIAITGGANGGKTVSISDKVKVLDAWFRQDAGAGTASTIQLFNDAAGSNAITDAMVTTGADTSVVRAGTLNDANATVDPGGTGVLRANWTSGASDAPAGELYVICVPVA